MFRLFSFAGRVDGEVLPNPARLPDLAADCCLVLLPSRWAWVLIAGSLTVSPDFLRACPSRLFAIVAVPMRSRLVLVRISEFLAPSLDLFGSAVLLPILSELFIDGFVVAETDGLLVLIRLPVREVVLLLTRLSEPLADDLDVAENDGLLVLIRLPIREVVV